MNKKSLIILFFLVCLLLIFRFYNNAYLQYWGNDEEDHSGVVQRMIIEKKPTLISPNPTLGTSLGSFFHILSIPLFLIAKLNPTIVLPLMSLLAIPTLYLIYLTGKYIGGIRLGYVSAFLYSVSFLASLFDRRWWAFSLNPLLTALSVYSLIKLVTEKDYRFSITLALAAGFAFHADPTLLVILVSAVVTILVFKLSIWNKYLSVAFLIIFLFLAPLAWFELRHPGAIIQPLILTFQRKQIQIPQTNNSFMLTSLATGAQTIARLVFPQSSQFLDRHFRADLNYDPPFGGLVAVIFAILMLIYPFSILFRNNAKESEKTGIAILGIYLVTFSFGLTLFMLLYKHGPQQYYFTVLFPVIFLLMGMTIQKLLKKNRLFGWGLLASILLVNFYALTHSRLKYPLSVKEQIVTAVSKQLDGADFSLYAKGSDLEGGGFTRLFLLQNKIPKKSYIYAPLDWIYRTHSLYLTTPTSIDQEKIVIIASSPLKSQSPYLLYQQKFDQIYVSILDNKTSWFKEKDLQQL